MADKVVLISSKRLMTQWKKYEIESKENKVIMTYEMFADYIDETYERLKLSLNAPENKRTAQRLKNKIISHTQYLISKKLIDVRFGLLYLAKIDKAYIDHSLKERQRQYDDKQAFSSDTFKRREEAIRQEERKRTLEEFNITPESEEEEVEQKTNYTLTIDLSSLRGDKAKLIGDNNE